MSFQDKLTSGVQDQVRARLEARRLEKERAQAQAEVVAPAGQSSGVVSTPPASAGPGSGGATALTNTPVRTPVGPGDASSQFLEDLRATEGSPEIPLRRSKKRGTETSSSRGHRSKKSRRSQVPEGAFIQLVDEEDSPRATKESAIPSPPPRIPGATSTPPPSGRPTISPILVPGGSSRMVFPEIDPATLPAVATYWGDNAATLGFPAPPPTTSGGTISLQFPGSCLEATATTAGQVMSGLNRLEDWEKLRSFQTWFLHQKACQLEMQALAYRNTLAMRAVAGDTWSARAQGLEASVQKLTSERAARAAEVAKLDKEKEAILANLQKAAAACEQHQNDLANTRSDNARLLAENKDLEVRVKDLEKMVVDSHAERRRRLDEARAAGYESGMAEGRRLGKLEAGEEHFQQGVAVCRSQILMSPPGQKFFEVLLEGLPDAFLHSHLFRQRFLENLTDMATEMLFGITDQLGVSERAAEVDLSEVLKAAMSKAPAINPEHGENFPWYMDTFKAAAVAFRGHREPNAPPIEYLAPGHIDYPVHRANDASQQHLQLAFAANTVRMLRRDVDRELILRGQDPEEVLKQAGVVDEEVGGPTSEEVAPNAPGPALGPVILPAGVGIVRIDPRAEPPPHPEAPLVANVPLVEGENSGGEEEEVPEVDDEPPPNLDGVAAPGGNVV